MKEYYVYILASKSKVLYTGVTSNLDQRIYAHKSGTHAGFSKRYNVHRLVHVESFSDVRDAIAREKQIKAWRREKKMALIEEENPTWLDLADAMR